MWSSIQLVSVLGSLLVLVAYVASQFGYLSAKGLAYAFANIAGSGILAVIAALEEQWGFLLLEGAWASVSLLAAVGRMAKPDEQRERRLSGAKILPFRWIFTRMHERRANRVHGDLSDGADELCFELSKGLL